MDEGRFNFHSNYFGTAKDAENRLRAVGIGNKAEFFINDNHISTVGVPGVVHAGDVYVMTGLYDGSERDGAITKVTDWRIIDRTEG